MKYFKFPVMLHSYQERVERSTHGFMNAHSAGGVRVAHTGSSREVDSSSFVFVLLTSTRLAPTNVLSCLSFCNKLEESRLKKKLRIHETTNKETRIRN